MTDWKLIAQAQGLAHPDRDLDRFTAPLAALGETFRPLTAGLTPDLEPDTELHLDPEDHR
jgi:hypothetical protein